MSSLMFPHSDEQESLIYQDDYWDKYICFDNDSKEVSLEGEFTKAQLLKIADLIPD